MSTRNRNRRLRKVESGVGTGGAWDVQVAMPGVSWCGECECVKPREDTPWRRYICKQRGKCFYKQISYSHPSVYMPTPKKSKHKNAKEHNLELIKQVAVRRANGKHKSNIRPERDAKGRFKPRTQVDVVYNRRRNRNMHMQSMWETIQRG